MDRIKEKEIRNDVLREENKNLIIKFYDNGNWDYPFVIIKRKDKSSVKKLLKEYQKDEDYNFDDFINIVKERGLFIEVMHPNVEWFF